MENNSEKVYIYDIPFSKWGMKDTVDYLTQSIKERKPHQVVTANPIIVMESKHNDTYKKAVQQADLVVPDGTGIVWAADYIGHPVKERVGGFDLMHELLSIGEQYEWKVYLLGAEDEVVKEAAHNMSKQFPSLRIVGVRDGYFTESEDAEVIADIQKVQPDLLFVARSVNTQEPWIAKYKQQLQVPLMMGVGGSFDVIAGKLKRAPKLFIQLRLEWFYRLLQQPTRYKRMLALPKFVMQVRKDKKKLQQANL
nr:WecB/TagA/CpsF family glycosyltransferase [Longirhabdus pacifica]